MKKQQSAKALIIRLEKGGKGILIPRDFLEMIGLSDDQLVMVEVTDHEIRVKSPAVNYAKLIGLLSGKDR
jgi:antitoxin component of MazEF toxin-antitoxin module